MDLCQATAMAERIWTITTVLFAVGWFCHWLWAKRHDRKVVDKYLKDLEDDD